MSLNGESTSILAVIQEMVLKNESLPYLLSALIILVCVCLYLYFQNVRLRGEIAKLNKNRYSDGRRPGDLLNPNIEPVTQRSAAAPYSSESSVSVQFEAADGNSSDVTEEDTDEDSGGEKEYNFVDPNFDLPPVLPEKNITGTVDSENGDAVYGNDKRYSPDLYYGRVSKDAKVELLDRRVYKNEFETTIIKVKVLENEWKDEIGKICWVGLDVTTLRDRYDPRTGLIG